MGGEKLTKRKVTRICLACQKPYKCSVAHLKTHLWNRALIFENGFWFTRDNRFIKTSNTRQDEAAFATALDIVAMYQNCDDPEQEVADYFGFTKERFAQFVKKRRRAA